ncbi:MAG: UDP-2,3-diacylglucosamine diphosphatase LpxI, partial [Alphaproteobacteria bacterium]|nr:UDP-2,3-diacylglucosamine diphosphatase LpxI [Alphaproteobacteria bacterium]
FVGEHADSQLPQGIPFINIKIGQVAAAITFFRKELVNKVVFAGAVKRPNFNDLSLDVKGASWLLKLGKSIFAGDDVLLRSVAELLNKEGFEIISGTELIGDKAFVENGILSQKKPKKSDWLDIQKGFNVAKAIGQLDIGQSVVICNGDVLGVECVEGTDALIKRCSELRKQSTGGVLVKVSKPQQDQRLDLPTVGISTLENLHTYGFLGLAVESEHCIVLDKEKFIEKANELSMFFVGIDNEYGHK